jgi:hypothetical protein
MAAEQLAKFMTLLRCHCHPAEDCNSKAPSDSHAGNCNQGFEKALVQGLVCVAAVHFETAAAAVGALGGVRQHHQGVLDTAWTADNLTSVFCSPVTDQGTMGVMQPVQWLVQSADRWVLCCAVLFMCVCVCAVFQAQHGTGLP